MEKLNCWQVKNCGREPNGLKSHELGVCPTAEEPRLDGAHGGKNGGRACWVVAATLCGGKEQGSFGQKKGVVTADEALKALKKHFEKKDIVIGEVAEKELYFEAEIKDRNNTVIDKVIVDKRTGRIRSIY